MDDLDFHDELMEDIVDIVNVDLDMEIKQLYSEEAEYIYTEIKPKHKNKSRYRRGLSGSFADGKNHESTIIRKNKNIISYQIKNNRTTDCDCAVCSGKDIFLDDLIEDGIYGKTKLKPRPVSERVSEKIENEQLVENVLESKLRSKGWNVK